MGRCLLNCLHAGSWASWLALAYVVVNVGNVLVPHQPKVGAVLSFARDLLDRVSLLVPQAAAGTLKLPMALSKPVAPSEPQG